MKLARPKVMVVAEDVANGKGNVQQLELRLNQMAEEHRQDLQTAHDEFTTTLTAQKAKLARAEDKVREAEEQLQHVTTALEQSRSETTECRTQLAAKESAMQDVQTELEDLLIVFGDLESKRGLDKKRLKELGEPVSDGEDEAEGETDEQDVTI